MERCPRVSEHWHVTTLRAPLLYERPLENYIHALKFGSARRLGRPLGLILAHHVVVCDAARRIDALIAMPLHKKRLLERGFNQALEIARPVASATGLRLLTSGIGRRSDTLPQARLRARERRTNVRGAFFVRRNVRGLRLAVVDDVVTTAATVNALARTLLEAGAVEVHAWAVARAPQAVNPGRGSPA